METARHGTDFKRKKIQLTFAIQKSTINITSLVFILPFTNRQVVRPFSIPNIKNFNNYRSPGVNFIKVFAPA